MEDRHIDAIINIVDSLWHFVLLFSCRSFTDDVKIAYLPNGWCGIAEQMHCIREAICQFDNHSLSLLYFFYRRFTGDIARDAHHVTAVDFMQSFTDKNKEVNGAKFNNIDFVCADVTKLEQPHGR